MEKEFVPKKEFAPYELALRLKQLGFDEPCWCYFMGDVFNSSMFLKDYEYLDTMPQKYITYTLAPLRQQVFEWFREKYDLWCCIQKYPTSENPSRCYYEIKGDNINTDKDESPNSYMSGWFNYYEEAELACLGKLIEIIEQEKK